MKNTIKSLPLDQLTLPEIKTATFKDGRGRMYTYAPSMATMEFMDKFPGHTKISGMLDSSGSEWLEKAFIFCSVDCFDPPLYIQFGRSFEDAYESYLDNDESLLISKEDWKDYAVESDSPTCSFNSNGEPVDAEGVHGFEVTLASVQF